MYYLCKLLYKLYPKTFKAFLVEEFFDGIPSEVNNEAVRFLSKGRKTLEKWLLWQSYIWQRRSTSNFKNSPYYDGILTHIKALLLIIESGKYEDPVVPEKREVKDTLVDDLAGVNKFLIRGKSKISEAEDSKG